MKYLSTECKSIDDVMLGGIPIGKVTSLISRPNLGKSWLAVQCAVSSNKQNDKPVLIVDTEGEDYSHRIDCMEKRFDIKSNIEIKEVFSLQEFARLFGYDLNIEYSDAGQAKITMEPCKCNIKNYGMVIVDSFSEPFKSGILEKTANLPARSTIANQIQATFRKIASTQDIPFLLTCHVTRDPTKIYSFGDPHGGDNFLYNSKYIFQILPSTDILKKEYGDDIRRVRRYRHIDAPMSEPELVRLKMDVGFMEA